MQPGSPGASTAKLVSATPTAVLGQRCKQNLIPSNSLVSEGFVPFREEIDKWEHFIASLIPRTHSPLRIA